MLSVSQASRSRVRMNRARWRSLISSVIVARENFDIFRATICRRSCQPSLRCKFDQPRPPVGRPLSIKLLLWIIRNVHRKNKKTLKTRFYEVKPLKTSNENVVCKVILTDWNKKLSYRTDNARCGWCCPPKQADDEPWNGRSRSLKDRSSVIVPIILALNSNLTSIFNRSTCHIYIHIYISRL